MKITVGDSFLYDTDFEGERIRIAVNLIFVNNPEQGKNDIFVVVDPDKYFEVLE